MSPVRGSTPDLQLGSYHQMGALDLCQYPQTGICSYFGDLALSDKFSVFRADLYQNKYAGSDFNGVWDFAGSLAPVPEPATWAMMTLGLGLTGAAVRRRHHAAPTVL
jgi:hypothetical protein